MTCANCLYYSVCPDSKNGIISGCPFFNDKSEWVHLPCKVGDTVYKFGYTSCHLGETYPDSYSCEGCCDKCDIKKVVKEYTVPSLRFIFNEFMSDSCIYYLTREEAEEALKEREKNDC